MKNFIKSIFTDKEWDADAAKTVGFLLIVVGCVGFFFGKDNFQWLIGTGAGLLATGKISEEASGKNDGN